MQNVNLVGYLLAKSPIEQCLIPFEVVVATELEISVDHVGCAERPNKNHYLSYLTAVFIPHDQLRKQILLSVPDNDGDSQLSSVCE